MRVQQRVMAWGIGFPQPRISRRAPAFQCFLALSVLAGTTVAQEAPPPVQEPPPAAEAPAQHVQQSAEQLQQLVAPIALYADTLIAQILAASTFPEQVVEADRWLQSSPGLQGDALAQAADQQPWDASVKALTAFPAVLGNMDKNLSWTSSLGDAYYNQPQDVMAAIQVMRQRAQAAGNLQTTPQQMVETQGPDIEIEPANPEVVYVPAYDPWAAYGLPVSPWPGWYAYPGIWFGGPYLSFGVGFPIGFIAGFGWGWHHWGFDWRSRHVDFDHAHYISRSTTFYNRGNFYGGARGRGGFEGDSRSAPGRSGGGGARPAAPSRAAGGIRPEESRPEMGGAARAAQAGPAAGGFGRAFTNPGVAPRPFNGSVPAARGYAVPQGQSGTRSGAFSGYNGGGEARGFASRGSASFGGGGAARGGGARGGGRR